MNIIYLNRADVEKDALGSKLLSLFPNYKGRSFRIMHRESISFKGTMWDGGSKSYYVIVKLDGCDAVAIPPSQFMEKNCLHEETYKLPIGYIVVEHSIFCGQDMGIIFHINPQQSLQLLPKANEKFTRDERIVLAATKSLKSSYGGISNFRFYEANRLTGITEKQWNDSKTSLINKGLLNKVGAITTDGKNVIGLTGLHQL